MVIVSAKAPWLVSAEEGRSFNGYTAKDDFSFDIHVSADVSKTAKPQVLDMIRSFEITASPELAEMRKLGSDLKAAALPQERENLLLAFTQKYPHNAWAFSLLAEEYFNAKQDQMAEQAYLKALENHRKQPIINPLDLWLCYDGLGLIRLKAKRYDVAKPYFEKGYKCAHDMHGIGNQEKSKEAVAHSAYSFACLYAKTGDLKACLKYLGEAIQVSPAKKTDAKKDPDFDGVKDEPDFKKLVAD